MKKSTHFQARQSQRGITQAMIDIVMAFGDSSGDKIILTKKQAIALNREILFLLQQRII